jgi:hypothetical protein
LGDQKSGTSAIAHLLADFGAMSKTIDIPPLWPPVVFKSIATGEMDFAMFVKRNRFYFSTGLVKEPSLTFFSDKVIERFPNAKFLFVVRDPRDNIRSWLNRMNISGHMEDVTLPSNTSSLDATIWTEEENLNYIGVLAHKWNKAVDNYFLHKDHMIIARYEDFIIDKYRFIARLAKEIGVPEKGDISDRLNIQYQPIGDHSLTWRDFFGIKNMMLIENICRPHMMKLGYIRHDLPT